MKFPIPSNDKRAGTSHLSADRTTKIKASRLPRSASRRFDSSARTEHRNDGRRGAYPPTATESTHDKIQNSRRRSDPCVRARQPRNGAGSRSTIPAIARSSIQTPIARTGDREAPTAAATSVRPIAIRPIGIATGRTATTALTKSGFWPGDVAAGVVGGAVGTAAAIAASPSAARNTPAATGLSASPAPCSAARTAGGISASKAVRESRSEKAAGKAAFSMRERSKRFLRFWPFATKSDIRAAEDRTKGGIFHPSPIASIRRFSSAVEQRFCKPKVGSSILSTGTTLRYLADMLQIDGLGCGAMSKALSPRPQPYFSITGGRPGLPRPGFPAAGLQALAEIRATATERYGAL